jgi:hypothetical protein
MANLDPELLRLEEVLRLARVRLALVIEKVGDPAAIKAAEDLCAEAAAAVAARGHRVTVIETPGRGDKGDRRR